MICYKETYFVNLKGIDFVNVKSHDIANVHLRKFCTFVYLDLSEIDSFIEHNNNYNTTIIYYFCYAPQITNKLLQSIKKIKQMEANVIIFTFDYWAFDKETENIYKNLFQASNYKIITFAKNIDRLNYLYGCDFSKYSHNIIFNSIWCCYEKSFCVYNENPDKKLLLIGAISKHYPERKVLHTSKNKNITVLKYNVNELKVTSTSFNMSLNKYFACFTSSVYISPRNSNVLFNTHNIMLKTFEILASGSLLVMPETEKNELELIGLIHMENCYLIDFTKNVDEQINYIFQNIDIFENIRHNGYNFSNSFTSINKFNELNSILQLKT